MESVCSSIDYNIGVNPNAHLDTADHPILWYFARFDENTGDVSQAIDKDNPKLCNSCQKDTEIVFSKDNIRLCKKCLDIFRDKYG